MYEVKRGKRLRTTKRVRVRETIRDREERETERENEIGLARAVSVDECDE